MNPSLHPSPPRLVDVAHQILTHYIKPGQWVVDATLGNGHDAAFLAKAVGPTGRVYAFDLQPLAMEVATMVLDTKKCLQWCTLILAGHENMEVQLPSEAPGRIQAIMFNLGYLPHGDKSILTHPQTTVKALNASLRLLATGGLLSVIAYRGHAGGAEEFQAVKDWIARNHNAISVLQEQDSQHPSGTGPFLWLMQKNSLSHCHLQEMKTAKPGSHTDCCIT